MFTQRRIVIWILLSLFSIFNFIDEAVAQASERAIRVRDASGRCGLYVQKAGVGASRKWVSSLNPEEMQDALAKFEKLDELEFILLGPDSNEEGQQLVRFVQAHLKSEGVEDKPVHLLRHGLYISPLNKPSTGMWVADPSDQAIQAFLETRPDLSNAQVYYAGAPIYGPDAENIKLRLHIALTKNGYTDVPIHILSSPQSLADEIRWFFPLKEDWQKPTLGELLPSLGFYALSNSTFAVIMLHTLGAQEAIPVIIVNAAQSAMMTVPRQFWGNFFMRGRNFSEKFARQLGISAIFSVGLYAASQYGHGGVDHLAQILTVGGAGLMLSKIWIKAFFQASWRMPVESGIPVWVAHETRQGNETEARAYGTWYRQAATNIATPAWGYSTLTDSYLFELLKKWTWGDVVMGVVGGTFAIANRAPALYKAPIAGVHATKKAVGKVRSGIQWAVDLSQELAESDKDAWTVLREKRERDAAKRAAETTLPPDPQ